MRIAFFVLLALNLVYLAWAGFVDTPPEVPLVSSATPPLPSLTLVSERAADRDSELVQPVLGQARGAAGGQALPAVVDVSPAASARCVSVGPFNDLARAAKAAALLRERGFSPRQRAEQGEAWDGYWVFVGGLKSAADETKLVTALTRAGISDAHTMPETSDGRRVSVGLFSERDRAEKRAQAVKRLGYAAEVTERKQSGSVYWVDLELGAKDRTVPTEGLVSLEDTGSRLEIRVCPTGAPASGPERSPTPSPRDSRPAATTADAGVPRPG